MLIATGIDISWSAAGRIVFTLWRGGARSLGALQTDAGQGSGSGLNESGRGALAFKARWAAGNPANGFRRNWASVQMKPIPFQAQALAPGAASAPAVVITRQAVARSATW